MAALPRAHDLMSAGVGGDVVAARGDAEAHREVLRLPPTVPVSAGSKHRKGNMVYDHALCAVRGSLARVAGSRQANHRLAL